MKFTYVLASWEGTASDSRILKDALTREEPLRILEGEYKFLFNSDDLSICAIVSYMIPLCM